MLVLALDASGVGAFAACVRDGVVVAERRSEAARGIPALLPAMAEAVLDGAVLDGAGRPDLVAVTSGPGSFTGIRAAMSFAQGFGLAAGVFVAGVPVPRAIAAELPDVSQRAVWVALDSRRGRIFLDRGEGPVSTGLDALPRPEGPVLLAGDAAVPVAAMLAALGCDVMLSDLRRPGPLGVALAGLRRLADGAPLADLPVDPVYVDAPEARHAAAQRPAPA